MTYLSVIIPAYNEKENISKGLLDQVVEYLNQQSYTWEVIISDDGSTDGSVAALEQFAEKNKNVRVLRNKHTGKAQTVTSGMLNAKGSWRLFTDFDQSTPISEVKKLLERAEQGFDIVIGSREMVGAKRDKEPWYRHLMGRGFNLLVQMVAVPGVLDTQCGFKLFLRPVANYLFSRQKTDGFSFDVEVLFLARKSHCKIAEVPVNWTNIPGSKVNLLTDSLAMLVDIVRFRVRSLAGGYR